MKAKNVIAVGVVTLALTACSMSKEITVDSIAADGIVGGSYVFASGMPDVKSDDLYFQEFSRPFKQALNDKGYRPAANGQPGDVVVYFTYGLGDGKTTHQTYTTPVYGMVGGQSYSVQETSGGTTTTRQVYVPVTTRIVGRETHVYSYTTYNAYAVLEARRGEGGTGAPLWKTTVQMRTDSTDLRSSVPLMAHAAAPYLGSNTGQAIVIKVSGKEAQLKAIAPTGASQQ